MTKLSRITFFERQQIELYLKTGKPHRWIGRKLNRGHTDISREIKRNGGRYLPYRAKDAQRVCEARQRKKNRKKLEKGNNIELKNYVVAKLREDWSPEQIAGRLKSNQLSDSAATISHESIYRYIYDGAGRFEYLYPHLRTKRHRRQRQFSRKKRDKIKIPNRISIIFRPEEITSREKIGGWETDSMQFSKQRSVVSGQYERKTMLCRLHKLRSKESAETETAIADSIESTPTGMWQSITRDNGLENVKHLNTFDNFNVPSFFCDTYSAWQKGDIENLNKLIRQYLPKKIDMSKISQDDIYEIQERLNNRPRKTLNYLTPNEIVANYVASGAIES